MEGIDTLAEAASFALGSLHDKTQLDTMHIASIVSYSAAKVGWLFASCTEQ
jgi:hypothetical protein